jgi:hypothetical protein
MTSRDAADCGLKIPSDDIEDRRLADAIASDDPPPFTIGDSEGDVLEEFVRAEGDADVGDGK